MFLPYVVQVADKNGFDFGGENNGGVAAFRHVGNAYQYAKRVFEESKLETRVLDTNGKPKEVHRFGNEAMIIVKTYENLGSSAESEAKRFSVCLASLGHQSEIVKILGRSGWRVICDCKAVEFYEKKQ